jgi:hypothetical protein
MLVPIFAKENLYAGVNPHLNSFLQLETDFWPGFHLMFIVKVLEAVDRHLPDGYYAILRFDMQLREITQYEDEEFIAGVEVFASETPQSNETPLLRIESLTPANKPGGIRHARYLENRLSILERGLPLVEIDFPHHSPPINPTLPSYAAGEVGAYPFLIIVTDPRPSIQEGTITIYGIHVNEPLPVITLPSFGSQVMTLDLNPAYNDACVSTRLFYLDIIDYAALPLGFDRYSPDDQARIRARMAAIAAAQRD